MASKALDMLAVDRFRMDEMDRRILLTLIDKYPRPVPSGFLMRSPRGRMATAAVEEHFESKMPDNFAKQVNLF
ncbi:MAG: hypothetical protein D3925_14950 [Candidatus Electrothrix sp. AR5]|nr:hypothetical protein [Candidatus Electrothrix sp. AR5]